MSEKCDHVYPSHVYDVRHENGTWVWACPGCGDSIRPLTDDEVTEWVDDYDDE